MDQDFLSAVSYKQKMKLPYRSYLGMLSPRAKWETVSGGKWRLGWDTAEACQGVVVWFTKPGHKETATSYNWGKLLNSHLVSLGTELNYVMWYFK